MPFGSRGPGDSPLVRRRGMWYHLIRQELRWNRNLSTRKIDDEKHPDCGGRNGSDGRRCGAGRRLDARDGSCQCGQDERLGGGRAARRKAGAGARRDPAGLSAFLRRGVVLAACGSSSGARGRARDSPLRRRGLFLRRLPRREEDRQQRGRGEHLRVRRDRRAQGGVPARRARDQPRRGGDRGIHVQDRAAPQQVREDGIQARLVLQHGRHHAARHAGGRAVRARDGRVREGQLEDRPRDG